MTLLVTGGAGFIGSNFVLDWLKQTDEPIVNLDLLTYAGSKRNLAALEGDARHVFVHGDICDRALVDSLFERFRPRAVVHMAAESHVDRSISGPAAFVRTNVEGTFTLLEAARCHWTHMDVADKQAFRFLHVGTDEVYGSLGPGDPSFTEDHPCEPNSPYSATKAASDHLVRAWHHTYGLPVLTSRCGNNYGPLQFPEKLIPHMIVNALAGRPLPLYGDGLNVRDWLYVKDHARALCAILERGSVGQVYNIGGGQQKTNREIVETICALLDELRPRDDGSYAGLVAFVTDRPGHDRRYAMDVEKIQTELGWQADESFDSGMRKTVQWYLQNPEWVSAVQAGTAGCEGLSGGARP